MMQMTVGDLKAQFSMVLEEVQKGNDVEILYGRSKKPVAKITKMEEKPKKKRPLGMYEGIATYWEDETFEFTPENLFDNMDDLL